MKLKEIMKKNIQIWTSKADPVLWSSASVPRPKQETETGRGMSLTLLTVPGYSTAPVACFWRVIFQPPGVYLQDTHPSWETHQCHTLAVGRHIAQCWVSETARVGLVVANKQRIEGSAALCAALLELRLIRYEAISEQASVSCERSHQRLHWESHQIFYSRPLWTQTTSPPPPKPQPPHSSSHLNEETGWKFNENSVLLKPTAAAAWSKDRNVLFTYFALCVQAVGWKLQMEGRIIDEYLLASDERSKWYKCVPFQWSIQPCVIAVICGKGHARNDFGWGGESPVYVCCAWCGGPQSDGLGRWASGAGGVFGG